MGTCTDAERRLIEELVIPDMEDARDHRDLVAEVVMERLTPELREKMFRAHTAAHLAQADRDAVWENLNRIGIAGPRLVDKVWKMAEAEAARRVAERKGT